MPRGSSSKRERQYEHIKESAQERGASTGRAEEMAARTVNKERVRSGEAKSSQSSGSSRSSGSSGASGSWGASGRGGSRSGRGGSQGATYDQLYEEAKRRGIHGRSDMNKQQLMKALGK